MNQTTVAAQNGLSGERTFSTVSFPVTGDVETDLVSAMVACVAAMPPSGTYENHFQIAARVLSYLASRYRDGSEAGEKYAKSLQNIQQFSAGSSQAGLGAPTPPYSSGSQPIPSLGAIANAWAKEIHDLWQFPKHTPRDGLAPGA